MPKPDEAATALIGTTQKLPRIRQSIAKNMKFGLDTAAQLTTVMEVDVTRVAALRAKAKTGFAAREGVNLSFLPFFVKAALEAAEGLPGDQLHAVRATSRRSPTTAASTWASRSTPRAG